MPGISKNQVDKWYSQTSRHEIVHSTTYENADVNNTIIQTMVNLKGWFYNTNTHEYIHIVW